MAARVRAPSRGGAPVTGTDRPSSRGLDDWSAAPSADRAAALLAAAQAAAGERRRPAVAALPRDHRRPGVPRRTCPTARAREAWAETAFTAIAAERLQPRGHARLAGADPRRPRRTCATSASRANRRGPSRRSAAARVNSAPTSSGPQPERRDASHRSRAGRGSASWRRMGCRRRCATSPACCTTCWWCRSTCTRPPSRSPGSATACA